MFLIIIFILIIVIFNYFRLNIDRTSDGLWLLWYGRKENRKYIELWQE